MTRDTEAQVSESDETSTEKMLRTAKAVKIEPMPKPAVSLPLPTGILKSEMTSEESLKIADRIATRIVELSDGDLEPQHTRYHISLKVGAGPYSNAVTVSKRDDRVNFFITSTNLLRKAEAEGFKPKRAEAKHPWHKDRFRFWELGLNDIEAQQVLFREIVKESVSVVMDRKRKKS